VRRSLTERCQRSMQSETLLDEKHESF